MLSDGAPLLAHEHTPSESCHSSGRRRITVLLGALVMLLVLVVGVLGALLALSYQRECSGSETGESFASLRNYCAHIDPIQ
jgi:quinol-cytochrome oxidoreductase complex cytochrome b subunit